MYSIHFVLPKEGIYARNSRIPFVMVPFNDTSVI